MRGHMGVGVEIKCRPPFRCSVDELHALQRVCVVIDAVSVVDVQAKD